MPSASLAWLAVTLCLVGGCAGGPPPARPPVDFTLDAAVVGAVDDTNPMRPWVGHRYVLFPDGSLHHDVGWPLTSGHLAPARRVLTRREMLELWELGEQAGLTDPELAGRNAGLQTEEPGPEPAIVVLLGGQGQWWSLREPLGEGEDRTAVMPLLLRLAELSWAGETSRRAVVAPKRYDFGPDPYVRFR